MDVIRWADKLRACIDSLMRTPYVRSLEMQIAREQVHFQQRLKDKDAMIADLKVRLAVAETDAMRERRKKEAVPAKPVPDFAGPIPYQDELARMAEEPAEPEETEDGAHGE